MNILQLCSKVPNPPKDGGAVAMDILTKGLIGHGAGVKVLALSTYKHPFDENKISADYLAKTNIEAVFVDTRPKPVKAFLNLFSNESYNMSRFYSKEVDSKLTDVLKSNSFDVIQLETLFVAPYVNTIRKYSKAKIVLRSQNIEYKIWEQRTANTNNPILKFYYGLLARRLKVYELRMLNNYDGIAAITPEDTEGFRKLGCTKPLVSIPFGIDISSIKTDTTIKEEFPSCFHLGAMNWGPNIEGVKWLLDNVWEKVTALQPDIKLYLAGRYMPEWLNKLDKKNIEVVGEVKSQFEFMQSKGIMLVPLLSGGGMRIKIIEGMATGKTIISTSLGAEGVPYEHKKNILIANTPEEFADRINLCVNDPGLYRSIGKNSQQLVNEHFDNNKICRNLLDFYEQLLRS
ncbi:MAG: glycosyltransferase family 4 protein [Bacteroidia bacterium]|nr:glycosyltransferase family 4 protein [Bacteroidia bacterium]